MWPKKSRENNGFSHQSQNMDARNHTSPAPSSRRLNKAIAETGICSRRKADELIFAGRVTVNGSIERNPARYLTNTDRLQLDGKELHKEEKKLYVLMNKPVQTVCTMSDPEGRQTVIELLPPRFRGTRLFPVGRLDYFSEGLLLLTNDGDFAMRLTHPRYHQSKIYEVLVRGPVSNGILEEMANGMTLPDGKKLLPVKVSRSALPDGNTSLRMELRQGINRQIRRMCEKAGLVILRLRRVKQGCLALRGLRPGECRPLEQGEVEALMASTAGSPTQAPLDARHTGRKKC